MVTVGIVCLGIMRLRCVPRRLLSRPKWIILAVVAVLCILFILDFTSTSYDEINPQDIKISTNYFVSEDKIATRYRARNRVLRESCQTMKQYYMVQNSEAAVKEHLVVDKKHKIVYCAIEKIGCTFWKRIFQILNGWRNVSDPFSIRGIHAYEGYLTAKKMPFDKIYQVLQHSTKFMFVREPFERLFSGYIDKLFAPNAAYWNFIGRYIVKGFRPQASNFSRECGHDVTFDEFVQYFIYSQSANEHRDAHFVPSFEHCRPCEIQYDYIGKMETFKDDTFHILKQLNLEHLVKFNNFQNETESDALVDAIDYVYSMRRPIERCMTLNEALFRAWRKLQIRGIISKHINFPYDKSSTEFVPPEDFKRVLFEAHAQSGSPKMRKKNRQEALLEAFSSLSPNLLEKLRDSLIIDSKLFGYEEIPKVIREMDRSAIARKRFKYLDMS